MIIVAIDGGAASGKSTLAKTLAKRLAYLYVDTGTHYRALTAFFLSSSKPLTLFAEAILPELELSTIITDAEASIQIGGQAYPQNVLRTEAVNKTVSSVASLSAARQKLLSYQRSLEALAIKAGFSGLVIEGRDIGTVIFPKANFKFFLNADLNTRKERRQAQGEADAIQERDAMDSSRKSAPLIRAQDAYVLDTSLLSPEETVQAALRIIHHG